MNASLLTLSIILLVLILLSGFFSGAEIGMMSLNRYRLRHLVRKKDRQAIRVDGLLQHPDKLLSVVLIGNTLANIVASTVATLMGQRLYGDMGVAIATTLLTVAVLVVSEMTPKTLAAMHPQRVAFACSAPLKLLQALFAPLVYLITAMANGLLRLLGVRMEKGQRDALTGEELRTVVHEAGGLLPVAHKSMVISLLDLEQATVEDIMIPKVEITGIDLDQPWQSILSQLETAQHTRLPLYRGSIDNLEGLVHLRSVLNLSLEGRLTPESLINMAEAPYYIPEATPLNVQLHNFQKMKRRISFVVDEYGDLQGLVTMEDILEEVVGDFTTDVSSLGKEIMPQPDGSYLIDASITLRQLQRMLGWKLPALGPRTLSGLVIEYLGYIPPADCCLRMDAWQIEILRVGENMVKTVRMFRAPKKRAAEGSLIS
ncbi:Mg2+ and Co2+ transporter CorB [Legionella geestiana]|uniref:Mg2+ and Co2+ transporter CorB n=1 Tax=Legionella geestiana TaxID=45065 RepID=A0A0W0TT50_9GAMM|nr:HlyC/CorC family transporter [Legionella geestiana]KTC98797.1 Mg2+ and Co2+ transporter CorB [Legionella geestiana]QBS12801.1 HlyC/CorC family transporter [Legionella geestiana]QDQ39482.1 HlyC/CorC family transporter [Legionella geestiana]STX54720.1 Mg2 and Co2 transporter [Legionella geestiana]